MSKHYYVQDSESGLYYNNRGGYPRTNWKAKPRIFSSSGLKNSMLNELVYAHWYLLSEEEQQRRLSAVKLAYSFNYIKDTSERYRQAAYAYWHEIKHKPLAELMPPSWTLHTIEIGG
jgi:hypothetical protein